MILHEFLEGAVDYLFLGPCARQAHGFRQQFLVQFYVRAHFTPPVVYEHTPTTVFFGGGSELSESAPYTDRWHGRYGLPGIAVIGAQWGDEGKGKVVDALAAQADYVVRYSGGANAGHTVVVGDEICKLHHLPCGVLHERPVSILGAGMVIDPWTFIEEFDEFAATKDPGEVYISHEAHMVLPHHRKNDEGGGFVGTTGRGIGPSYSDKARRVGLRFGDLVDEPAHRAPLEA